MENYVRNKYYKNHQSHCRTQFAGILVPSKSTTLLTGKFQMTDFLLMKKQRPIKFVHSEETADTGALPVLSQKKNL